MTSVTLIHLERSALAGYVQSQVKNLLPLPDNDDLNLIDVHLDEALRRVGRCIDQVRMWRPGEFDVLHSSQYCIFLYYLANTIWRREQQRSICTKLFLLNKALNAIDCFYEIELPDVFFIGHSVGIVLAKATYGNHLVLYQNSTVGKNHGNAPVLEHGVIMYPNTAIIGDCLVREGSVISQGVSVINRNTEANRVVYQGVSGSLVFKQERHFILGDFFRDV
jgi:serine O-acetyltransferase